MTALWLGTEPSDDQGKKQINQCTHFISPYSHIPFGLPTHLPQACCQTESSGSSKCHPQSCWVWLLFLRKEIAFFSLRASSGPFGSIGNTECCQTSRRWPLCGVGDPGHRLCQPCRAPWCSPSLWGFGSPLCKASIIPPHTVHFTLYHLSRWKVLHCINAWVFIYIKAGSGVWLSRKFEEFITQTSSKEGFVLRTIRSEMLHCLSTALIFILFFPLPMSWRRI